MDVIARQKIAGALDLSHVGDFARYEEERLHHVAGGLGAYLGAVVFDGSGSYDIAFAIMFGASVVALLLSATLRKPSVSDV
jgi:hypothetical protein